MLDTGKLMARYYVAFESMERFLNLKGTESLGELVRERKREEEGEDGGRREDKIVHTVISQVEELSKCEEFQEVRLRVNEKRILNQLNKDKHKITIRCNYIHYVMR